MYLRIVRAVLLASATLAASGGTMYPQNNAAKQAAANIDSLQPEATRKPAPAFSQVDAHGNTIDLHAYKGRVVLLDFWATWCGGCKLEIPWFMAFDKQYQSQGLTVIGVAMDDEGWVKVRPFLIQPKDEETGGNTAMQYPVILGNTSLSKSYRLSSLPMTVLIDREGRVALSHTGVVDQGDFESHIQHLLKEH